MAEGECQDKRPTCDWPVTQDGQSRPCGSENRVYEVHGRGRYTGMPRKTPVCEKHLSDAWKVWNVDSAQPINPL
jgi:hypothetical protein